MAKANVSARDRDMAMQTFLLLRKPKTEPKVGPKAKPKKGRETNFFSLPQILRQRILYESIPQKTFRRLAQIALRLSQAAYLERERAVRYVHYGWSVDHDSIYHFFIKRVCKLLGVHWVIFHDLVLVRKMWFLCYTHFARIFNDAWTSGRNDDDRYVLAKKFTWSAEGDLENLELAHGISQTRSHALLCKGTECWATITGKRALSMDEYTVATNERYQPAELRRSEFVDMCKVVFPSRYLPPPTLKYHHQKEVNYPGLIAADGARAFLPPELWRQILFNALSSNHLDRLAKVEYYCKGIGSRFTASLVCKLAQIHPGWTVDLYYVQRQWNSEIERRINDFNAEHNARVETFKDLLKQHRIGEITQETCDDITTATYEAMTPWRTRTSALNLMALEDIFDIPDKHKSIVTRGLRTEMCKDPSTILGTIHGKYRYAKFRRHWGNRHEEDPYVWSSMEYGDRQVDEDDLPFARPLATKTA